MSINCIALGKRICFYRLKFNITQEKLAALTNCSREYIAYLESGTKTPSLPTLIDLANVLHISVDDTDCSNNLYAGSPSYLLILFSALSAFAVGGLSIERNQKPLTPENTLAITHHDKQKQVEVKRSSRANPHEIRLFSGCPYAVVK